MSPSDGFKYYKHQKEQNTNWSDIDSGNIYISSTINMLHSQEGNDLLRRGDISLCI